MKIAWYYFSTMAKSKLAKPPKYVRVPIRFAEPDYQLIRRAAEYERTSMNSWMLRSVMATAREVAAKMPRQA
jgi:uncharacterized protein (DUF1778 family)